MKIVLDHAIGRSDWLIISGQQINNPLKEAISILSGKYRRFTLVHPAYVSKLCNKRITLKIVFTENSNCFTGK